MTKLCECCGKTKSLDEFGKNKSKWDGLQRHCKVCCRTHSKAYYKLDPVKWVTLTRQNKHRRQEENRLWLWDFLKTHPCVDCGEPDPVVLEFDHVRGVKRREISKLVAEGALTTTLAAEVAKCEVRCANCHRRRTAIQFKWRKGAVLVPAA